MKKSDMIPGFVLLFIGVAIIVNKLNIISFNINIFFKGWWTLFLIIPSFVSLFTEKDKLDSFFWLCVGVVTLLCVREIIAFDTIKDLIFPVIIIFWGLTLIVKGLGNNDKDVKAEKVAFISGTNLVSNFALRESVVIDEKFEGATLEAVFGGIKLDLRSAIITEDVVINTTSIFGGIEIYLPDNCVFEVNSSAAFGGVKQVKKRELIVGAKRIIVNSKCLFGGVEIK